MTDSKKIYADIFVAHDVFHTFHVRTVKMYRCKTLHGAFGECYTALEDMVDSIGEDVIMKFESDMVPSARECFDESEIDGDDVVDRQEMLNCGYEIMEDFEERFADRLNEADNTMAELIGKHRRKFTDLCALLQREMYAAPKEEED